jgi:hypothetical protein
LIFQTDKLGLEVEDRGCGFATGGERHGIGLVAMRERAELMGGTIEFLRPEVGGTLIRLSVPKEVAREGSPKKVPFTKGTAAENTPAETSGAERVREERPKSEKSHG